MQEYLVILLVIVSLASLVLVAVHGLFRSRMHLRTGTVFAAAGVCLLLGAFFPWALAAFALPAALSIYLGAIILLAFAFSYCDIKISAQGPANPVIITEPGNEIAEPAPNVSNAFEGNEEIAFAQACAALDCNAPAAAHPAPVPAEAAAADLPDGITPEPVQDCGITSLTETAAGETESPPATLLPETQGPSHLEESPGEPPLPVPESTPETVRREETREPVKAVYAAAGATEEYGLMPVLETAEEHFEGRELPVVELSPAMNAAILAAPMNGYKNSVKTVNDNISAGFAAKASGDMVSALVSFMNAFSLNREPRAAAALTVEISNVYLELGHYPQAKLFIKSLLEQEHLNVTPMRQQLAERLLYLETFTGLLQVAGLPKNAPYSKVPNLVKLKANIDTAEATKETKGVLK